MILFINGIRGNVARWTEKLARHARSKKGVGWTKSKTVSNVNEKLGRWPSHKEQALQFLVPTSGSSVSCLILAPRTSDSWSLYLYEFLYSHSPHISHFPHNIQITTNKNKCKWYKFWSKETDWIFKRQDATKKESTIYFLKRNFKYT